MGRQPGDPAAELREATREAHAAIKDLRAVLVEARALLAEVGPKVRSEFAADMAEGLDAVLVTAQQAAMDRMEVFMSLLLGLDQGEGETLLDAFRRYLDRQAPATGTERVEVTGNIL